MIQFAHDFTLDTYDLEIPLTSDSQPNVVNMRVNVIEDLPVSVDICIADGEGFVADCYIRSGPHRCLLGESGTQGLMAKLIRATAENDMGEILSERDAYEQGAREANDEHRTTRANAL